MTVLYPNLCYNEVCYKGTAVYHIRWYNVFVQIRQVQLGVKAAKY